MKCIYNFEDNFSTLSHLQTNFLQTHKQNRDTNTDRLLHTCDSLIFFFFLGVQRW